MAMRHTDCPDSGMADSRSNLTAAMAAPFAIAIQVRVWQTQPQWPQHEPRRACASIAVTSTAEGL